MEITDGNKLIAEFMGYVLHSSFDGDMTYWNHGDKYFKPKAVIRLDKGEVLEFDTSWDWLMPVVEKIERIEGVIVDIHREATKIKFYISDIKEWSTTKWDQEDKIKHVYQAILEFITWYDSTKQPLTKLSTNH